ncbi:CapA family protein [Geodermatophilus sp. YIM 151500]|uniref:CapA family protein n=1 Tax=Geodermatophilus sp. YIM 151500 TaxID=2984531 RepID=UPI0021E385B6|nr:CapA family protein [Geodermatophilus sp. YIM 151500]MCV2490909.1 CapA family protein [Geodermatophilus sp. YIM 151500]
MRRWWLPTLAVLVVLLAATAVITANSRPPGADGDSSTLVARVVDERGEPLAGTRLRLGTGGTVTTDGNGRVRVPAPARPHLVTVAADGHLPRTQAVRPGTPTEIRLTSDAARTVSVRIAGDTMFGRRFYDRDDGGERSAGHLADGAAVADHAALLAPVRPLLEDADVTVLSLTTALTDRPWPDLTGTRPATFHPTKDVVFASSPAVAPALLESGVDVVSLANSHVYDALDAGVETTLAALDQAGIARFGAGRTLDEAWAPAVVERKGQRLAFLGCTTITGAEHAIRFVAETGHGGAAPCSTPRLEREVRTARATADAVVVVIDGGLEFARQQTDFVRRLGGAAARAGAAVVAGSHPHVVGGVGLDGATVFAETLGNFLYDRNVWPTLLSYLLRVDLRDGRAVLGTVDPLFLEDYVPRPTVDVLADAAARAAAGPLPGSPGRLRPPGVVLGADVVPTPREVDVAFEGGSVVRLSPGWSVRDAVGGTASPAVRLGEDLLWTGTFEDMDTDPRTDGAHGWSLGPAARVTSSAACAGDVGVELTRSPVSTEDVLVTPVHRQLVGPGTVVSLVAEVRDASPGATLELRWYPATLGAIGAVTTLAIPPGSYDEGSCAQVRIDERVPEGMVAAQPMLRLAPTFDVHRGARLAVDNVQLVAWGAAGENGRRYDVVDVLEDVTLPLVDDAAVSPEPVAHRSTPS